MTAAIILYRVVSVLYSYAATNVLYAESALPSVLEYVRGAFLACFVGCLIAALVAAEYGRVPVKIRLCVIATVLLALDGAASLLIDLGEGSISQALALVALLNVVLDLVYSALPVWILVPLTALLRRKGCDESRSLLLCSVLFFVCRLIPKIVSVLSFLIEVEFRPYAREVLTIAGELLQYIVLYGGAVWLLAVLFFSVFSRSVGSVKK